MTTTPKLKLTGKQAYVLKHVAKVGRLSAVHAGGDPDQGLKTAVNAALSLIED